MIWISKRNVKPGRMGPCGKNFQLGTDLMYGNAPAALGICEFTDADDPDALWSLRVFADFNQGFKKHFPVPSFILFRMVFNVIPEWQPGETREPLTLVSAAPLKDQRARVSVRAGLFPIGYSFSPKEWIDKAVASNPGNQSYKAYHYEAGLMGPAPDFGKGF